MQEEILRNYRQRLSRRLYDYLEAEGLLREPMEFECPICGGTGRFADENTWFCARCGNAGDLLELARLRWPERGEWDRIRLLCRKLGIKVTELEIFSGEELARMDLQPREYLVEELLPAQGLTLLAAPPKSGKSWMVLQLAAALASGEPFLDRSTRRCQTLYISLEDTPLRLRERSRALGCLGSGDIFYCTRTELLGKGFEESVDAFLRDRPQVGLVIVDTLQKIRQVSREGSSYGEEYSVMDKLKELADRRGLAVLLVHHTNKKEDLEDAMNAVSGTMAITGGVDSVWLLRRPRRLEGRALLQVTGRDTADQLLELDFDRKSFHWHYLGPGESDPGGEGKQDEQDEQLLEALEDFPKPGEIWVGTATELLTALGLEKHMDSRALGRSLRRVELELKLEGLVVDYRKGSKQRTLLLRRRGSARAPRAPEEGSLFDVRMEDELPEGW